MVFKRKIYDRMLRWKQERNGETALLIQGARRVGKSTIVEEFAKREYKSYLLIDFTLASPEVRALFQDLSNIDYIFFQLQVIYKVNLTERESVIIFDEVQKEPAARQAIKHLVKDHRYDYIETGSLISVRKMGAEILLPSEETKINMYPMDYEEFRWALGDTATIPLLRQAWEQNIPLREAHRNAMRDFRLYMLIGGMPQAVAEYLKTNNLSAVDLVKRDIISIYADDFEKIDDGGRAKAMYDSIPAQLNKNFSRFQVTTATGGDVINRVGDIIKSMADSMTTNVAYHSNDPNIGLALSKDTERFKMYASDTGLFITLAFMDKDVTENVIYNKLLSDKLNANLGYVYENVVAQILKASGKDLYYHTIPINGGKKYYEVDFLVPDGSKVSPIEIKSSGYRTHASLDAFCDKFSDRIQNRYVIYTKDLHREGGITYLPVYMTPFL